MKQFLSILFLVLAIQLESQNLNTLRSKEDLLRAVESKGISKSVLCIDYDCIKDLVDFYPIEAIEYLTILEGSLDSLWGLNRFVNLTHFYYQGNLNFFHSKFMPNGLDSIEIQLENSPKWSLNSETNVRQCKIFLPRNCGSIPLFFTAFPRVGFLHLSGASLLIDTEEIAEREMNSMLESNGFSKPQLKSLTLENCRLSSFYLKSILKYTKELEDISLFNVSIDTLSIESEKINFIQISNCRLKYIAILPGFIEELILSENDLRHFDFPNTVIQQLDIHNNKLKRIPVFDYKSLKALDISFNRISDSLELNDLAALKYLYFLENDRFVVLNSNANQLVAASWFPGIASHSNLSVVFLPGNRLLKKFRLPQDVTYIPKRLYEYRIFSGNGFAGSFNSLLLHRKWNDQQAN